MWSFLALLTVASGKMPPFQLLAVCFAIGSIPGIVVLLLRPERLQLLRQPAKVWITGIAGLFGYHFLYFTALRHARRFVGKQAVTDYLRELSEEDLGEARKLLEKAGREHETLILTGQVAGAIAKAADDGKFDLLVLGSKGRGGLKDLLIGSVARRVSEISKVPVLLVK